MDDQADRRAGADRDCWLNLEIARGELVPGPRHVLLRGLTDRLRTIAIDDLIHYIVASLDEPRTFNKEFDVGNDDVMTNSQMVDAAVEVVGRGHPTKIQLPIGILKLIAPIAERAGKLPKGSFRGFLDSLDADTVGNPRPIREILPRELMTFRQAVKRAWQLD